jgi:uncharacterized protein YggE
VLALTVAVLVATGFNATPSAAQTQSNNNVMPRTVSVVGEGTASGKPDIAEVTIGVEVSGPDVQEATDEAEQKMEAILASIREQEIEEKDIQTTGFNIFADRPFQEGQPTNEVIYRVTNNVRVTVRDLNQVSTVLDSAVEAGANNIYGVN